MWNLSRLSNVSGFIPLGKILETPVTKPLTWSSTRVNPRVPQRSGLLSAARLLATGVSRLSCASSLLIMTI
jgi:hypothetical protein